jgi:FkbM family methyltransferase
MYYGVREMDKEIIEKYLNFNNGFFIEVGGNDGITQSNTAHLEFNKQWRGILVEAIPYKYELMVNNRPNSICINGCLSNVDGNIITFNDVNLMSFIENSRKSEVEDELWISEGEKCQNISRKKYELSTKKLQTIIDEYNIKNIDFFSLDVEGHELSVLEGIDFSKTRPKYILIECTHKEEIFEFMLKNNYECIDKFVIHDFLFKDNLSL